MPKESNPNGKARMNISISYQNKEQIEILADKNIRSASQQAEHMIALYIQYEDLIIEMELKAALHSKGI